jgi:hypothetical protein
MGGVARCPGTTLDPVRCGLRSMFNAAGSSFRATLNAICSSVCTALNGSFDLGNLAVRSSGGWLCRFFGADPGAAQQH